MGWIVNEYNKNDCKLVYIDIESIDLSMENLIDQYIVEICFKDSSFNIKKAKKYIKDFVDTDDEDRKKGAVAEFFLHLYLNSIDMKQECLFKNLEENSPKKGFDGVYKDTNEEVWFVESKSGTVKSSTHKSKVQEAYRDLKDKFSSTTTNDPWLNAYNHLKIIDPNDSLLDKFRTLSDEYDAGNALDISEYNLSPCGTVYDDNKTYFNSKCIADDVFSYFDGREYNKCFSICATQRAIKEFEDYLKK